MLIVKVPFKNSVGAWHEGITDGTEKAPDIVLEMLNDVWLSESGKEINADLFTVEEIKKDIYKEAKEIFEKNKKENIIFIGGDHSCSFHLARAFLENYKNSCIIVFDAHPDCIQQSEKQNQKPNHEEWLSSLITSGFEGKNIFLLSTRASCIEEEDFVKKSGINIYSCKEIFENRERICDDIMEQARKFDAIYLSIDIDAVDPSAAPGTSYIEPAGMSARELLYFIQRLRLLKNFRAADIVEINPSKDINNMTAKLAARIVAELF